MKFFKAKTSTAATAIFCNVVAVAFTLFLQASDVHASESKTDRDVKTGTSPSQASIDLAKGVKVYRKNCIECHGEEGRGDGDRAGTIPKRMPNFGQAQAVVDMTADKVIANFDETHPDDFVKDKVSESDLRASIKYIQDAFMLAAATADSSDGRAIFAKVCSVCHGDRGNAASWARNSLNPPPFDFTSYKAKKISRRNMINTVTYGRDKTAMVGWGTQLSPSEIAAVVDYIRSTFVFPDANLAENSEVQTANTSDRHANHNHGDHGSGPENLERPFNNGLVGDVTAGGKIYFASCAACHGKTGSGDGPRAYFIFPRPENFVSKRARSELNRVHLFESISEGINGTVMPAWARVLNDQQIADVAEFVFTSFIKPTDGEGVQTKLVKTDEHQSHGDHQSHDDHMKTDEHQSHGDHQSHDDHMKTDEHQSHGDHQSHDDHMKTDDHQSHDDHSHQKKK